MEFAARVVIAGGRIGSVRVRGRLGTSALSQGQVSARFFSRRCRAVSGVGGGVTCRLFTICLAPASLDAYRAAASRCVSLSTSRKA